MNPLKRLDSKSRLLIKIGLITVGTVYGGHKLVQFVSPTEEELLKVLIMFSPIQCIINNMFLNFILF